MVVVAGGYGENGAPLAQTETLDLSSEEWQLGPPLPEGTNNLLNIHSRIHSLFIHKGLRSEGHFGLDGTAFYCYSKGTIGPFI